MLLSPLIRVWFENDRKQESSFPPSGLEEYRARHEQF